MRDKKSPRTLFSNHSESHKGKSTQSATWLPWPTQCYFLVHKAKRAYQTWCSIPLADYSHDTREASALLPVILSFMCALHGSTSSTRLEEVSTTII